MVNEEILKKSKEITLEKCKGKIADEKLDMLFNNMPDPRKDSVDNKDASASIVSAVLWSRVNCSIKGMPWEFHAAAWGPGIGGGSSEGTIYYSSACNSWEDFFEKSTRYWAQGIADIGGFFMITWFDKNSTPTGQFVGALAGAGGFEIGGSGRWEVIDDYIIA